MAYTTIKKPSDYFNTKLFTGDGTSDRAITGIGFQPDLVWLKARSKANDNNLMDAVRGLYKLRSNATAGEADVSSEFKSFDSDGITVTENATSEFNNNSTTYALWNWLGANGTASNTDGSITSTVSANTTSGFSIVSYTGNATAGATVGHGLGVTPDMFIVKVTSTTNNWAVYHKSMGETKAMYLDGNSAETTDGWLNNTAPDSSVFTLSGGNYGNTSGNTHIAYCFAEKPGFSKFGSYTGNGNTDGAFVYTGFKPAFLMIKRRSGAQQWEIHDNKRQGYNPDNEFLYADLGYAEGTLNRIELFSNGFKAITTDDSVNGSADTYIYMAFAEEPLVGDNPATAR